ncbi:MAG TPA: hypothetical protein GXX17_01735 [Clostridiales bacterium]|nr:hypothetical protein [Clostridiales bacterium]
MLKRLSAALMAILLCTVFTGCNFLSSDIDSMMRPPRPTGTVYEVQLALERAVKGDFALKYPRTGNHQSAIVFKDIDSDGKEEALAFYTTQSGTERTVNIHMNLLIQTEKGWESSHDIQLAGDGVEQVDFADLDNDGKPEVIVGWQIYSTIDKRLAVYSINEKKIVQKMQEKYFQYAISDLDLDEYPELLLITQTDGKAVAKLFSLSSKGVSEKGSCMLDNNVTSYYTPVVSTLRGGRQPAVYIDAAKGSDKIITELIFYDQNQKKFRNPFVDINSTDNITQRRAPEICRDIDSDGVMDIPYTLPFGGYGELSVDNSPYYINWRNYDGQTFETTLTTYMDYSGGYYLALKPSWVGFVTLTIKGSSRTFWLWDAKNKVATNMLLEIRIIPAESWQNEAEKYSGYIVLESTDNNVYIAKLGENLIDYQLTEEELRASFHLLKTY